MFIDREAGGSKNLSKEGITLHALFSMTDLKDASSA
ncbi:MAG: orotate phosphoribosyltransferase [Candidatus Latescibacterota bacterium]|jgi:orotate phosphoribosyltransferase